jgi:hypothetical protein
VIEKILERSPKKFKAQFVAELVNSPNLVQIMNNCYGNYVVQKALAFADTKSLPKMVSFIFENINTI